MRVDDFDFNLPESAIALEPARPRDSARMLHIKDNAFVDKTIRDLPNILRDGDLLIVNDTKVIPAQLKGMRPARDSLGRDVSVDVTLHKNMPSDEGQLWRSFIRPAKRMQVGDHIHFGENFSAKIIARDGAEASLLFDMKPHDFREALLVNGVPPLPPYIARKRGVRACDHEDYQTYFAKAEGSVAAPTAGLHFTDQLIASLAAKNVQIETITLHVGAGTFLPMMVDNTKDHIMHSEWGQITKDQAGRINKVREGGGRAVAVGTTSLRLLESAVDQAGKIQPFSDETDIFITPGYEFRAVDGLITNFHLPRSTLFMLVCAMAGMNTMKGAYDHAVKTGYRFYSYGDACFIEN